MRDVAWRMIEPDGVRAALAARELERTDHHVVLHLPVGSPRLSATGEKGGPRGSYLMPGRWEGGHEDKVWQGKGMVVVHRIGDDWSCWRWLEPDGSGWQPGTYVNLEEAWRTTPIGYDSCDLTLDVVVSADGSASFKDVDELAWAEAEGHCTAERAAWIRTVGDRAMAHVRADGWPLTEDWDRWRPAADQDLPTMPDGALDRYPTIASAMMSRTDRPLRRHR